MTNENFDKKDILDKFTTLDAWDKGGIMLLTLFKQVLDDKKLEILQNAVAIKVGWHTKQHKDTETCEYCSAVEEHIVMYKLIESYFKHGR